MNPVVFKGSKSRIGINFSTDNLKDISTLINGSSSSVIRGSTTPFTLCNIDQNGSSVKKLLNFNNNNCSLVIQFILKVQT